MNMWDEIRKAKSCEECPYKLGLIRTLVSPCHRCPKFLKKEKKEKHLNFKN